MKVQIATVTCLVTILELIPTQWADAQNIEDLKNGVVKITARTEGQQPKVGTGFVIDMQREAVYIVTAPHVLGDDPQPSVEFYHHPNQKLPARVYKRDFDPRTGDPTGLAVLIVEGAIPYSVRVLPLASDVDIEPSWHVTLIGHPRISGSEWIEADAIFQNQKGRYLVFKGNVNEGNSGGPVLLDGIVIGVVESTDALQIYAIPLSIIKESLKGWQIAWAEPLPRQVLRQESPKNLPREVIGKDGAPMVLVPAGEFVMGDDTGGREDNRPAHSVYLDAFYMDKYEVTVERYQRFLNDKNKNIEIKTPYEWDVGRDSLKPAIAMTYLEANIYCGWADKRLPTEAEWEKAARGIDGRVYPWGNSSPTEEHANWNRGYSILEHIGRELTGGFNLYDDQKLMPVGSFSRDKSPYEIYDMGGNVTEMVEDAYSRDYYKKSPALNPKGPYRDTSNGTVYKGGNFWSKRATDLYSFLRSEGGGRALGVGFRCAMGAR